MPYVIIYISRTIRLAKLQEKRLTEIPKKK